MTLQLDVSSSQVGANTSPADAPPPTCGGHRTRGHRWVLVPNAIAFAPVESRDALVAALCAGDRPEAGWAAWNASSAAADHALADLRG